MTDERDENVPLDQRFDDVLAAYLEALDAGWAPPRVQLLTRYPELAPDLVAFFANGDRVDRGAEPLRSAAGVVPVRAGAPTRAEARAGAPTGGAGGRVSGDSAPREASP